MEVNNCHYWPLENILTMLFFKNNKVNIPVDYEANEKAWMTSEILEELLQKCYKNLSLSTKLLLL